MYGVSEIRYLTLTEGPNTILLARVRWPDVADAITPGLSEWQTDPGLFDLPYDPSSTSVTRDRAETIAAEWGTDLPTGTSSDGSGPSVIRRMPANWSTLTSAERRAWGIESRRSRRRRGRGAHAHSRSRRRLRALLGRSASGSGERVANEPAEDAAEHPARAAAPSMGDEIARRSGSLPGTHYADLHDHRLAGIKLPIDDTRPSARPERPSGEPRPGVR